VVFFMKAPVVGGQRGAPMRLLRPGWLPD